MGTDIHLYVEHRVDGKWASADVWEPSKYEDDKTILTVPYGKHFYDNRNYDLFAILAGVRNGRGFAGIDTGDGFVPIAEPRGLPDDMSPEMLKESEHLDHTPSWLLLSELLAYDWTRTTTKRGWINGPQMLDWYDKRCGPKEYCGGISGQNIVYDTPEALAQAVKETPDDWNERREAVKRTLTNTYAQVSWTTPYYHAASDFLSECVPRLLRLGKPEDVRIVFWFDS